MNDWTDTNWTHALGTERLSLVRDALLAYSQANSGSPISHLAERMHHEAEVDMRRRSRAMLDWQDGGRAPEESWWPMTDLEGATYAATVARTVKAHAKRRRGV